MHKILIDLKVDRLRHSEQITSREQLALLSEWANKLALHSQFRIGDPGRSRLALADTEQIAAQECSIYLGEVLGGVTNLKGSHLIVLTACETSITDMQRVPNEALGLAAEFLQAGTAAVISMLWSIDDIVIYLLMTRFAQLYIDPQGLWSPARALAATQRWLREEASNHILADYDTLLSVHSTPTKLVLELCKRKLQHSMRGDKWQTRCVSLRRPVLLCRLRSNSSVIKVRAVNMKLTHMGVLSCKTLLNKTEICYFENKCSEHLQNT